MHRKQPNRIDRNIGMVGTIGRSVTGQGIRTVLELSCYLLFQLYNNNNACAWISNIVTSTDYLVHRRELTKQQN